MKKGTSISIGLMVAGCWLAIGVAWGGPPPEPPRQGGIPFCEEKLLECYVDVFECRVDLDICRATEGQAFPATGQTSCWDMYGGSIDCAGTGHDGEIQAGADLLYTVNDETIIDNNTKLEWAKQDDSGGIHDKDNDYTWDQAFAFIADLNASTFAGHDDWRLPNVKELTSIVNYYEHLDQPTVSEAFNTGGGYTGCTLPSCSCTEPGGYWSSTSYAGGQYMAWDVFFNDGGLGLGFKDFEVHVRAVRGGL